MRPLYLYQNGTRGDVVLARALARAVLECGAFELTLGVCRGDEDLVTDLERDGARVRVADYANTAHGAPLDLAALCPPDAVAIESPLGGYGGLPTRQWPDIVDAFERELRRRGIAAGFAPARDEVPMPGLAALAPMPQLARPGIYLDIARTRESTCWFVFDVERLARVLPECDLYCTAPVEGSAPNLIDASQLDWPHRAALADACVALVGSTRDPFALTLTPANRTKPKALCGHDARLTQPFWDYPGNPLELLATMDELVDFLIANVVEVAA
ncbi:MAG: hypothetical protein KDE27_00080 [Planctomycetes bacterium]|nr:hypothetical protein [Planctomycetota bacterium]